MTIAQILFFIPPFAIAIVAVFVIYNKMNQKISKKNIDKIILSFSAGFLLGISISLIFILWLFSDLYNYIVQIMPDMSLLIAILAISVAILFTIDSMIQTDNFQNSILEKLDDIKKNKTNVTEPEIVQKDYTSITSEDKIIFSHLFKRHQNLLVFGDSIDTKFSQMIALNGLILSLVIIKRTEVNNFYIYIFGIIFIILAIGVGIYGYKTREWYTGAKEKFFKDYDTFKPGLGIKKLKEQLLIDIKLNTEEQNHKALIFDIMLYIDILGFSMLVIGYYV